MDNEIKNNKNLKTRELLDQYEVKVELDLKTVSKAMNAMHSKLIWNCKQTLCNPI